MALSYMQTREEICDIAHRLWQLGFVAANDGNISVKLEDDLYITTPTGVSKSMVTPDKLVLVDGQGQVLEASGGYRPSSEFPMHLRCYAERADVQSSCRDRMLRRGTRPSAYGHRICHRPHSAGQLHHARGGVDHRLCTHRPLRHPLHPGDTRRNRPVFAGARRHHAG